MPIRFGLSGGASAFALKSAFRGPTGPTGATGTAASITVGSTTTGTAGTNASVANSGTSSAVILDFTIPRGNTGTTGATGAGYSATSSTSNTIASSGSKTFTTQTGLAYTAGARVRAADTGAPSTNYIEGVVTSYSGSTLTFTADYSAGSGTLTAWSLNLAGDRGATGATGPTGPSGALGVSGTPTVGQFGIWTNSTTQKGVSVTGLVKGNGASDPTAAVSGTDYAPATSGTSILKGNGSGGFSAATADTDYAGPNTISRASYVQSFFLG